ncbi:ASCH domain-containing protein [Methanolinea mesophila]|uniref:ASCH domain-containing protein n=1 Tax=Methanolinea mesophila TaxID=547055 RepID=UPI001AE2B044|nr:ASCH domain-containing protein [Methanolinea mesophila]
MRVLLSIKPQYADKILCGLKKYEFRKIIFKNEDIREIVIYSSSPTKKIVGTCAIGSVIEDRPMVLWEMFKEVSGICEEEFFSYFNGKEKGYAIEIEEINRFERPVDPREFNEKFVPPQSFQYINDAFYSKICNSNA